MNTPGKKLKRLAKQAAAAAVTKLTVLKTVLDEPGVGNSRDQMTDDDTKLLYTHLHQINNDLDDVSDYVRKRTHKGNHQKIASTLAPWSLMIPEPLLGTNKEITLNTLNAPKDEASSPEVGNSFDFNYDVFSQELYPENFAAFDAKIM